MPTGGVDKLLLGSKQTSFHTKRRVVFRMLSLDSERTLKRVPSKGVYPGCERPSGRRRALKRRGRCPSTGNWH
ncbi:hypothetical protein Y1Q_0021380 [Alligator mississippiensis]|uniref:Uncharacterized protein n=1 Tax=Alligator mississippiensis TaxID=8496 RepID=A0A151P9J5_ALLMI|nr:hypothetical protein Y1Q_0021380 [Alligator mississippiensis]